MYVQGDFNTTQDIAYFDEAFGPMVTAFSADAEQCRAARCHGHGTCVGERECFCYTGWGGASCAEQTQSRLKADDVGRVRCHNPADCTEELQAALSNATLSRIMIPSGGPWNALPLVLNRSNVVLTFEPGAILQARRGFFHGGGDVLLSVERVENVSLVGAGASLRMWRKMILSRSDIAFAVSLTRRVSYRR